MDSSIFFTWITAVVTLTSVLGYLLWKYTSRNDDYWKKRGVNYIPRSSILSVLWVVRNTTFSKLVLENKEKYGTIYGQFEMSTPVLSVADPDLLRDILVKDFHIFPFRRDLRAGDPISDNVVSILQGENWKRVRTIITPAFTSKRMRQMSSIINECSKAIADNLGKKSKNVVVDFKMLFGAFTMDVIASSAFGTKIDAYSDPNNDFIQQAKKNFIELSSWKIILFLMVPSPVLRLFGISLLMSNNFFKDVVMKVIETRKEQKKRYNDVLQILMDAVDEQDITENSDLNVDEEDRYGSVINNGLQTQMKYKKLSQNELLAQCVLFFFVGYETSASILTFLAYSLATNPEWQEKLIAEVDNAFDKHPDMSYDTVRDMKVLDAVISETLRMYPPLVVSERTAVEDYNLGDTGITIEKGMRVSFPIYALHFDPKYFPDPNKFDPERFLDSNNATFHQYAYLPFGAGPRNCLGMRFALLEIKLCITNILRHFRFRTHSTTKVPVEFRKAYSFISVSEMPLCVDKRTDV